tara:strand:- start:21869 stop:22561 length:693 start_codon:yes stop_codon:yes gene_type:complete
MQPYFLPYLGYWQLLEAVDRFVILDDVNYINRGWINRNRIARSDGMAQWMTVPLVKASQNKLINEIELQPGSEWRMKMLRTLQGVYGNSHQLHQGLELMRELLDTDELNLSRFLARSLRILRDQLGVSTEIVETSAQFPKDGKWGAERILSLCQVLSATKYVNLSGGREMYQRENFAERGIELIFLETNWENIKLKHGGCEGPNLSILDLLMHNDVSEICSALRHVRLCA